jgi:hypothetical protein
MIKNIDSFMTIGNSHEVCEDYIYSSFGVDPYIILSDGCSSSNNTDVGARVLVHSARNILNRFIYKTGMPINADTMGDMIANEADETIKKMGLNTSALDATLIIAYRLKNKIVINVFGDGNVILKKKDGTTKIYNYQYANNMPYYLSYYVDAGRQNQYCREMFDVDEGGKTMTTNLLRLNNDPALRDYHEYSHEDFVKIPTFVLPIEEYAMIGIASDGIESFGNPVSGLRKDHYVVLEELTAFKGTVGEFLKRRCKRAIKNYKKEGIEHYDDVSIGVMLIGDE